MKKFKLAKFLLIIPIGILAIALFGFIVMWLWNAILPVVLGVKAISFFQALGILVLSKILFGGFGGKRHWRGRHGWGEKMKERFENMSPEEREKFKAEWKNRCGNWGRFAKDDAATTPTN